MPAEPLVGRDESLGRVRDVIGRATAGERSLALVTGPAGIGKSSLVRAAVRDVDVVGWGTCVEAVAAPGYWPWSRALEMVAISVGADVAISAARDEASLLALIAPVFGTTMPSAGSERDRLLLMDAVSRWLLRVAAEHAPVVIVLDDLQWADASSLELLEFVARDSAPAAVAVIGCYRHDEVDEAARRRLSQLAMSVHHDRAGGIRTEPRSSCSLRGSPVGSARSSSTCSSVAPGVIPSSPRARSPGPRRAGPRSPDGGA